MSNEKHRPDSILGFGRKEQFFPLKNEDATELKTKKADHRPWVFINKSSPKKHGEKLFIDTLQDCLTLAHVWYSKIFFFALTCVEEKFFGEPYNGFSFSLKTNNDAVDDYSVRPTWEPEILKSTDPISRNGRFEATETHKFDMYDAAEKINIFQYQYLDNDSWKVYPLTPEVERAARKENDFKKLEVDQRFHFNNRECKIVKNFGAKNVKDIRGFQEWVPALEWVIEELPNFINVNSNDLAEYFPSSNDIISDENITWEGETHPVFSRSIPNGRKRRRNIAKGYFSGEAWQRHLNNEEVGVKSLFHYMALKDRLPHELQRANITIFAHLYQYKERIKWLTTDDPREPFLPDGLENYSLKQALDTIMSSNIESPAQTNGMRPPIPSALVGILKGYLCLLFRFAMFMEDIMDMIEIYKQEMGSLSESLKLDIESTIARLDHYDDELALDNPDIDRIFSIEDDHYFDSEDEDAKEEEMKRRKAETYYY